MTPDEFVDDTSEGPDGPRPRKQLSLEVGIGNARFHADGEGELVLEAFEHFRSFYSDYAGAPAPEPEPDERAGVAASPADEAKSASESRPGQSEGALPLSVFLDQKKLPRGNAALALGIAVWAKRYKDEEVVDADTLKGYWRISKRKVPSNIARDLGVAAKEGWLERTTTGKYSVTGYGEKVYDQLAASDA